MAGLIQDIIFRGVDQATGTVKDIEKATGKLDKGFSSLQKTLIGVGAALATGAFAKGIIATSARFEDLNDSLAAVTGSAQAGGKAFDFVTKFATKTQFSVEDLTKSYIKLKASGIEPTEELLNTFTDTAAITTDQIGTLEAITDLFSRTVSGGLGLEELNRLADRGVPVFRILEEQLDLTRLQISEYGKTAEGAAEITAALQKGIQEGYGGATQNVLDNLSTAMSNFGIAVSLAQNQIGEGGFRDALSDVVNQMTDLIVANEEAMVAIGRGLGSAVQLAGSAIEFMVDNIRVFKALGMAAIAFAGVRAFQALAIAIRGAALATINFNKVFRKNILGILVAAGVALAEFFGMFDDAIGAETEMDNLTRKLDRVSKKFGELKDSGDTAFDTIQDEGINVVRAIEYQNRKIQDQIKLLEEIADAERDRGETENYQKTLTAIEDLHDELERGKLAVDNYWDSLMGVPFEDLGFIGVNGVLVEQISLWDQLTNQSLENYIKKLEDLSDMDLYEKALLPAQIAEQNRKKALAEVDEFEKRKLITEKQANKRRAIINMESNQEIEALNKERRVKELESQGLSKEGARNLAEYEMMTQREKAEFILDNATQSFEELAKHNKAAFQAYKAFAIAQTVMDTYKAAQSAYTALAPIPFIGPALGIAAAAAAIASGMGRVNAIRSQQYGGRRTGGAVTGGSPFLVGEAGAEVFTPKTNGDIIPLDKTSTGKEVNVNFQITTLDASDFQDLLVRERGLIVNIINDAVLEQGREAVV